jgi:pSer/pThr/pTyr-binding forkhead associated (FHA) protein
MAVVIIVTNKAGNIVQEISLKGKVSLGRDSVCTIAIDDKAMSKIHATLELTAKGKVLFTDNNSSNGSSMSGNSIKTTEMKINNKIRIGNHYLEIVDAKLTSSERLSIGKSIPEDTLLAIPSADSTACKTRNLQLDKIKNKR